METIISELELLKLLKNQFPLSEKFTVTFIPKIIDPRKKDLSFANLIQTGNEINLSLHDREFNYYKTKNQNDFNNCPIGDC